LRGRGRRQRQDGGEQQGSSHHADCRAGRAEFTAEIRGNSRQPAGVRRDSPEIAARRDRASWHFMCVQRTGPCVMAIAPERHDGTTRQHARTPRTAHGRGEECLMPTVMPTLDELKKKYAPALEKIEKLGLSLKNLHIQDNKLFIKAAAPSEAAKNEVWTAIKAVDRTYGDLMADITIDPTLAPPAPKEAVYTVKAGDTLSKISKELYGDAARYMKIFEANRDLLKDPNVIKPGQVLKIPA
jgi:nucleoid-associated protein YgaU